MEKEKIKRIEKINKNKREGTPSVVVHRLKFAFSESAAKKVLKDPPAYFNEKIVKAAEAINELSDDEFAVAHMKARKAIRKKKEELLKEKFASK